MAEKIDISKSESEESTKKESKRVKSALKDQQKNLKDQEVTLKKQKETSDKAKLNRENLEKESKTLSDLGKKIDTDVKKISESIDNLSSPRKIKRFTKGISQLSTVNADLNDLSESTGEGIKVLSESINLMSDKKKIQLFAYAVKKISKLSDKINIINESSGEGIGRLTASIDKISDKKLIGKFKSGIKRLSKISSQIKSIDDSVGEGIKRLGETLDKVSDTTKINAFAGNLKTLIQSKNDINELNKIMLESKDFDNRFATSQDIEELKTLIESKSGGLIATGSSRDVLGDVEKIKEKQRDQRIITNIDTIKIETHQNQELLRQIKSRLGLMPTSSFGAPIDSKKDEKGEDKEGIMSSLIKMLNLGIGGILATKLKSFKSLGTKIISKMTSFPKMLADKVLDFKNTVVNAGKGIIKSITSKIPNIKDIGSNIVSKGKDVVMGVKDKAVGAVSKGFNFLSSTKDKVISGASKLNPITQIKKQAKNIFPKVATGMKKVAKKLPGIGPLIAMGELGFAAKDAHKMLAEGKTMREIAIAMIPKAGGALGAVLGGLAGSAIPIPVLGTLVGALGGDYVGKLLANRFAPEIATALGFTKANNEKLKDELIKSSTKEGNLQKNVLPKPISTNPNDLITKTNEMYEGSDAQIATQLNVQKEKNIVQPMPDLTPLFEMLGGKIDSLAGLIVSSSSGPSGSELLNSTPNRGSGYELYHQYMATQ